MSTSPNAPEKRARLLAMLDHGLVMLHLDPRGSDVIVPAGFKQQPVLRLNLAWGFNLPALDVGEAGVYAILSFNRVNFACTLPWDCIFALTWPDQEHDGAVWAEDAPTELRAAMGLAAEPARRAPPRPAPVVAEAADPETEAPEEPRLPPLFIVHEGGRSREREADRANEEAEASVAAATPRPRLRLVKG